MKWLEIIELRSVDINKDALCQQLATLMTDIEKEISISHGIRSYRRIPVETDFSIHLIHDTQNVETCGSALGVRIVSALKELGMVNHSVWKETTCT